MPWTADARTAGRTGNEPVDGMPVTAARTLVFTASGTGLGLAGHHLASAHSTSWQTVLLTSGLLFLLSFPFIRRARSLPSVMILTGTVQVALHMVFRRADSRPTQDLHAAHLHGTHFTAHDAWHAGHHNAVLMFTAHVATALLVAWCLQRADSACRSVADRIDGALAQWFRALIPAGTAPFVPHTVRPFRVRTRWHSYNSSMLAYAVARRGPPTAELALAV